MTIVFYLLITPYFLLLTPYSFYLLYLLFLLTPYKLYIKHQIEGAGEEVVFILAVAGDVEGVACVVFFLMEAALIACGPANVEIAPYLCLQSKYELAPQGVAADALLLEGQGAALPVGVLQVRAVNVIFVSGVAKAESPVDTVG